MGVKNMYQCLTCGSKIDLIIRYFTLPSNFINSNSYLLCNEHKNLHYYWDDIYDENGVRKKINHKEVIEREDNRRRKINERS
jgi:hypothetical protein